MSPIAARVRPVAVYVLMTVVGAAAFLYPFWLPSGSAPDGAHRLDAPILAAVVAALVVGAITLEVRRGTMNGATISLLAVLSAACAILRIIGLPAGGNAIFFLVVLAAAAFGPRFGLLLGLCAMAVSAVLTGGFGPWLPFQMLTLAWMGGGAGLVGRQTRTLSPWLEVCILAAYAWVWGFVFGAVMNLWFWPFIVDGGPLSWSPDYGLAQTLAHYWRFYVVTSFPWDAARAFVNAALVLLLGRSLLRSMRRFVGRTEPVAVWDAPRWLDRSPVEDGEAAAR